MSTPTIAPTAGVKTRERRCEACAAGVHFGDGELSCAAHSSAAERDELARIDGYAGPLALGRPAPGKGRADDAATFGHRYLWPVGAELDVSVRARLVRWARAEGLRRSGASHMCPTWILQGQCTGHADRCSPPAADWWRDGDVSGWYSARQFVLLAQPPTLGVRDRRVIATMAAVLGATVEIGNGRAAWLGRGEAVLLRKARRQT